MAENNKRRKKKKKRKNKKLIVSAAAFITAAATVVFCLYYIYFKTDFFDLKSVDIKGNSVYDYSYIMEKAEIELGKKIFSIDRKQAEEKLKSEVYVKDARAVYELPDKISLKITERIEKYQIPINNEYILIDDEGIVLRKSIEKFDLLTIESSTHVVYNIGDTVQFEGIESNDTIFKSIEFLNSEFGSETIRKTIAEDNNSLLFETEYGAMVKINLGDDIEYQIVFAMKIINDRLNNNLTVISGLIDFTKGDSPVYIEDFKLEEQLNE